MFRLNFMQKTIADNKLYTVIYLLNFIPKKYLAQIEKELKKTE